MEARLFHAQQVPEHFPMRTHEWPGSAQGWGKRPEEEPPKAQKTKPQSGF